MMKKQKLIAYTHVPTSPNIHGLHIMFFKILEVLEKEYEIYVLCRSKECYEFYLRRFSMQLKSMHLLQPVDNCKSGHYTFGLIEDMIDREAGNIDKAFWFFPGLSSVVPEARLKETYDGLLDKSLADKTIAVADQIDAAVVQQAEMLYSVIKHKPKFLYRVGDYTEPHLEKIIDYPMTLLSFYDDPSRGHHLFHDSALLHFDEDIEAASKDYDFVFGYTVEIPERAYLSDFCFSHVQQNDKFKLYVKDKHFSRFAPIDTQLATDEYFEKLRHSKFSLIAPSTDPKEVSVNRIYEDISRRCIPIFMKDVQHQKVFDKDVSQFISDYLTYDESRFPLLNDFIKTLDYDSLLEKLLSFEMFKKFRNREWLRQKILEECR